MKKIIKGIISAILSLVIIILVYFIVANIVATKNNSIASFFGYSISYVPTASMEPTIESNSTIIFDQDYNYDKLSVGDIIVYYNDENNIYVIHRIVKNTESGFVTKGDNNSIEDFKNDSSDYYYITKSNYVGKYKTTINVFRLDSTFSRIMVLILIVSSFGFIVISEVFSIKSIKKNSNDEDKEELRKELLEEIKKEIEERNAK